MMNQESADRYLKDFGDTLTEALRAILVATTVQELVKSPKTKAPHYVKLAAAAERVHESFKAQRNELFKDATDAEKKEFKTIVAKTSADAQMNVFLEVLEEKSGIRTKVTKDAMGQPQIEVVRQGPSEEELKELPPEMLEDYRRSTQELVVETLLIKPPRSKAEAQTLIEAIQAEEDESTKKIVEEAFGNFDPEHRDKVLNILKAEGRKVIAESVIRYLNNYVQEAEITDNDDLLVKLTQYETELEEQLEILMRPLTLNALMDLRYDAHGLGTILDAGKAKMAKDYNIHVYGDEAATRQLQGISNQIALMMTIAKLEAELTGEPNPLTREDARAIAIQQSQGRLPSPQATHGTPPSVQ